MEIQRLKITNIASIEKADIDFTESPLSADPIFLITGDTGTGKTTVLNAICLALYNRVPALSSLDVSNVDAEGLRISNTQQLMRKGTGYASVELHFIGNDGKPYIITWESRRAYNKPTGALQDLRRELQVLHNGTTITAIKEIEPEIERLVGVNFEQFMRTTMLAQGQFAMFMKANDNAKAAILEKLTETDIYTRIGREINLMYKDKNAELNAMKGRIADAHLLSDDQITEYQRIAADMESLKNRLAKDLSVVNGQIQWLESERTLANQLTVAEQIKQTATATVDSDSIVGERRTVEQWDATADIRRNINMVAQSISAIALLDRRMDELGHDPWHAILDGICGLQQSIDHLLVKSERISAKIQRQQVMTGVYSNAQRIAEMAKNATTATTERAKHQQEAVRQANAAALSSAGEAPLAQAVAKAKDGYEKQKSEVDRLRDTLSKYDLTAMADRFRTANDEVTRLQRAVNAVGELLRAKSEYDEAIKALADAEAQQSHAKKQLVDAQGRQPQAQQEYSMRESFLRGQMELQDVIVSLRERFAKTHECPLCGNQHATMRTDETVDAQVAQARIKAEEAKAQLDAVVAEINELKARLGSLDGDVAKCRKAADRCKSALGNAQSLVDKCAPGYQDRDALMLLQDLLAKAEETKGQCGSELKSATTLRDEFDKANERLVQLHQALETAVKRLDTQQQNTKTLNDSAQRSTEDANKAHERAVEIVNDVRELSLCASPDEDAQFAAIIKENTGCDCITLETLDSVCAFIVKGAEDYNTDVKAMEQYRRDMTEAEQCMARCQKTTSSLAERFGMQYVPRPIANIHLEVDIMSLNSQVDSLEGEIKAERQKMAELQSIVDAYFAETSLTRDLVETLSAMPESEIDQYRHCVAEADKALVEATTHVNVVSGQLQQLRERRPEIPDDTTIESLGEARDRMTQQSEDAIAENKHYLTLLEENERNVKIQAENIKKLETMKAELERWQALNDVFGRSDGAFFRKVAQSYILHLVLIQANRYLAMLTPRYVLECDDGSLSINVVDMHHGGSVRNVGLLSGGEGFIVSLALALGLSAISKNDMRIGTLFIDEGFGTLDHECLDTVLNVLNNLHSIDGRRIGIISHVQELKETIPTQIRLVRTGPSSSEVQVVTK